MEDHFWKEAKSISPPDDHTVQDETAKKEKHFQDVKVAAGNVCVSDLLGKKIIPVFFLWIRQTMIHKGFLFTFFNKPKVLPRHSGRKHFFFLKKNKQNFTSVPDFKVTHFPFRCKEVHVGLLQAATKSSRGKPKKDNNN